MKQLFISWVPFQRRSLSMQPYFEYELRFLSLSFKKKLLRPVEYVVKAWKTLNPLIHHHPHIIWIQLPPTLLLHLAHLYKAIFDHDALIVADAHNATFRYPWINIPLTKTLLNRSEVIIVHNDWVKEQALSLGLDPDRLFVLEDPPAALKKDVAVVSKGFKHPWVVFPCSFNHDEPIQTVIEAARLAPEITFVLTGNTARAKGIHDLSNLPDNVKLTGFLPEQEFDNLLWKTDAVLGLTKLEGIQLSVANEALGLGKPMILSNTETLKKLFYKGAVYVDTSSSDSIAEGCRQALTQAEKLTQETQELRIEREESWKEQASYLNKLISQQ